MPTSFDTPFFEHAANYTGHKTEPIPPVYEPEEVVETIVRLAIDPTDEVTIGTAAGYMTFLHQIVPGLTENIMGKNTHEAQIEKAPPASATSGSVHEPTAKGTDVKRRA